MKIFLFVFVMQWLVLSVQAQEINILDYGAIPNDTINDTESIMKAINDTKKGMLIIPQGTFIVTTLKLWTPIRIQLSEGAVLLKKSGTRGSIILIYSSNVDIIGKGILDGNRPNVQGAGGILVAGTATELNNINIDGITIRNTKGLGGCAINLEDASNVCIANTRLVNIEYISIFVRAVDNDVSNIEIINNLVDRSHEGLELEQGGIQVRGTKERKMSHVTIMDNEVFMPVGKVKTSGSGLCIESFQNVSNVLVSNNRTHGGSMGISFARTTNSLCSNNTIDSPYFYGIEQAVSSSNNLITGNTIKGEGLTQFGIQGNSGSSQITIKGNKISNTTLRGIQVDSCTNFAINNNEINLTFKGSYGIDIVKSFHGSVSNNVLHGNSISAKALMINTSASVSVMDNKIYDWTDNNGLHLYSGKPFTIDHILYKGNKAKGINKGIKTQLSNGAVLGKDIISIDNE